MLRQRKKKIEEVVQKLDAFTKVPEDYVEPSLAAALSKLNILRSWSTSRTHSLFQKMF